jgi:hypothetical protein
VAAADEDREAERTERRGKLIAKEVRKREREAEEDGGSTSQMTIPARFAVPVKKEPAATKRIKAEPVA